jgi:DNA-binding XRE family transcriptional regulator
MRYRQDQDPPAVAETVDRLRRHLAGADEGWFFAQIADKVSARRQELGLSQQQLARLVGTTQSSIARLERGGRPPRIDTLLKIADALECDLRVDLVPRAGPTKE